MESCRKFKLSTHSLSQWGKAKFDTSQNRKQPFLSLRLQFWQHRWIQRPRFPLKNRNFGNRKPFTAILTIFLCACAESALFVLPVRNLLSPSFSATSICYKWMEFFCDLTTFRIIFSHILNARAQKQLFLSFRLQLWVTITPLGSATRFHVRGGYFGNRSTHSVLFLHFYPEIRLISISGLLHLISWKVGHVLPWQSGYVPPNVKPIQPSITEIWHLYL